MKIRQLVPALLCCLLLSNPAFADAKFEAETAKESEAVKLTRDTQVGGYQLLTAAELKKMLDEAKPMLLVDTMPYDGSYRKEHLPGAKHFLFPVARMSSWDTRETDGKTEAALWSSHPTRPPGLATPPPLFFLASSFCEPIAPYTAAHDPTP